jgi:hypothetical protein
MLTLDQPQIQQNVNTEIHFTTDHGNWVPSNKTTQPTTFTLTGAGGSIITEYIVDAYNALVTVLGTVAPGLLTLTDGVNNEGASVSVQSIAGIQAEAVAEGDPTTNVGTPGDNAPPPVEDVPQ